MSSSEQRELAVGLIGVGRIGQVHARSLAEHPGARLAAVHDVDAARAGDLARSHGARFVPAVEELMDSGLDAVIVASPTPTHVELIAAAIEEGLPVLCEKPIDLNIGRVDSIRELVASAPTPVMLGFNRRFDPQFAEVRERVFAGEIGRPEQLTIISRDPSPPPSEYLAVSGGLYRDMAIHDLDMARFMLGEIVEVSATGGALFDEAARELGDIDTSVVTLRARSGALASITNSRHCAAGYDQRLEMFGSEGSLRADNLTTSAVRYDGARSSGARGPYLHFFLDRYREAYRRELEAFLAAARHGTVVEPDFEDGRAALLLADAAEESLLTGQRISVSPATKGIES